MKDTAQSQSKPRLESPSRESFIRSLQTSPLVKLALFSTDACFLPKWLSLFAFAFSHIQILSIFVHIALLSLPDNDNWLTKALAAIHKVSSVGELWDLADSPSLTLTILSIIAVVLSVEISCIICLAVGVFIPTLPVFWAEKTWCAMTNIHLYIFFYPAHFIGTKTLSLIWEDRANALVEVVPTVPLQIIIIICLVWNSIYSFGTLLFLSPKIKTKNFLCSHTRLMDFADLMIKAISPILWFYASNSKSFYTALLVINLLYALVRDGFLFWFLPYYKITVLKIAASFNAIITLFGFSTLLPKIIPYRKTSNNLVFAVLVFLIAAPMLIKLYSKQLDKILIKILTNPNKTNSYHLIHHWNVCKYFSSHCKPQRPRSKLIDEHHLFFGSAVMKSPYVVEMLSKEGSKSFWDPKVTESIEKDLFHFSLDLLKSSSLRSSDREILKCCLARYYSKYEGLYILADDLVDEGVTKSSSMCLTISFYIIRIDLFKRVSRMGVPHQDLQRDALDDKDSIAQSDIQKYFQMSDIYEYLKKCIADQLKPQVKFWEAFQVHEPDCSQMINLAKEVCQKALRVKRGWSHFQSISDNQFTQPYLMYGLYCSYVQNDFVLGNQFLNWYYTVEAKKQQEDRVTNNKIVMQVLYDSIQISVSGHSGNFGRIVECSDNIEKTLGFRRLMLLGKSINTVVPFLFSDKYDDTINQSDKLTVFENLDKSQDVQALDKEGYLVSCRAFVTLKFFYDATLCYYVLLHLNKSKKRLVSIRSNGKLVNCSRGFQDDLGFTDKDKGNLNVFSMCARLREIVYDFMESSKQQNISPKGPATTIQQQNTQTYESRISSFLDEPKKTIASDKSRRVSTMIREVLQQKYSKDEIFSFCYPPQRSQRSSISVKKTHRIMSYYVKFEASIFDGDIILNIGLNKVGPGSRRTDLANLTSINVAPDQELPEYVRKETNNVDESIVSPSLTSPVPRKKDKEGSICSPTPSSTNLRKSILKKGRMLQGTEAGQSEAGDDEDIDGLFFQTDENMLSMKLKSKTKGIVTTAFSEDNEDFKTLNVVTTDMNDIMYPLRSPASAADGEKLLCKIVTVIPDDVSAVKKKVTIESTEQGKSNHQSGIKPNDGDSDSLHMGASENPNNLVKIRTIKLEAKKERVDASENNIAKKFLKKDSQKLRHKAKTHREVQQVLEQRKHRKPAVVYNIIFAVAMIVELVFVVWLNSNVYNASQDAAVSSDVLQATLFRSYWVNLMNQEMRMWVAIRGRWLTFWPLSSQISTSNKTLNELSKQNQLLRMAIRNLKPEIQSAFFERNVNLYERNTTTKEFVLMAVDDTFQAFEKIIERGFRNVYKGTRLPAVSLDFIDRDSRFIFDNCYDDLLIASDRLIDVVEQDLFNGLTAARRNMTVFLSISIVLLGIFVAYSFKFIVNTNEEFRRFMKMFLTIPSREAKRTELVLSNFYTVISEGSEAERKMLLTNSVRLFANLKRAIAPNAFQQPSKRGTRRNVSKASLQKVNHRNWILMLQLAGAVAGTLAFMFVYYTRALNEINTIENHQISINSALENINRESLINAQAQALVMENSTTTIRREPIFPALKKNLESIKSIGELQSSLRDEKGQLSLAQQEIFFGLDCRKAVTPYYLLSAASTISACNVTGRRSGRLGLANILPELSTTMTQYLSDYQSSNKNRTNLIALYQQIPNKYLTLIDASTVFFLLSLNATIIEYQELIGDLEGQRTTLAWIAIVISLSLSVVLWVFVIRRLILKVFDKIDVLKMAPVKLILKNFLLKKFVEHLAQ